MTLNLDQDVVQMLQAVSEEQGRSVKELINETLRRTLKRPSQTATKPSASTKPYRIRPVSLGRCLVGNVDNVAEALALAEGEDFR